MKLSIGMKWKSIEGVFKGTSFTLISVTSEYARYKSDKTGIEYSCPRKHFEKYIQRVRAYWHDTNKAYKRKRESLRAC